MWKQYLQYGQAINFEDSSFFLKFLNGTNLFFKSWWNQTLKAEVYALKITQNK